MKKLFLLATLCFSLSAFSQERRDSLPPITDSTRILTIQDVIEFDAILQQKFTVRELGTYNELFQWWKRRIQERIATYPQPNSKPKNK
jgi:nicotinamide mononucleotide adenylyltransferase